MVNIYYTGIGAKKSGKHTVKEFLNRMNKTAKTQCIEYIADKKYKPCKRSRKMKSKVFFINDMSKKNKNKYNKLVNNCNTYKKSSKNKKCNLANYINYSGAIYNGLNVK
jgi:hypothetical protein